MKHKTKTTQKTKQSPKAFAVGSHEGQVFASVPYTLHDFKDALLFVSLGINLVILIAWLLAVISNDYASAIAYLILR